MFHRHVSRGTVTQTQEGEEESWPRSAAEASGHEERNRHIWEIYQQPDPGAPRDGIQGAPLDSALHHLEIGPVAQRVPSKSIRKRLARCIASAASPTQSSSPCSCGPAGQSALRVFHRHVSCGTEGPNSGRLAGTPTRRG